MPVHLQPYYRQLGFTRGQYPQARLMAMKPLRCRFYPTMTDQQQDQVVDRLKRVLAHE